MVEGWQLVTATEALTRALLGVALGGGVHAALTAVLPGAPAGWRQAVYGARGVGGGVQ